MKQQTLTVRVNTPLTPQVWRMVLEGDTSDITAPGQFLNLQLDGFDLRRPISIHDWDDTSLTIIYKTVGEGTLHMTKLAPGARLDALTGLGNGYDTAKSGAAPAAHRRRRRHPAPVCGCASSCCGRAKNPTVILGLQCNTEEMFLEAEFAGSGRPRPGDDGGRQRWRPRLCDGRSWQTLPTPTSTPAAPCPCSGQLNRPRRPAASSALRSGWAAASAPAWAAPARPNHGNKRICKDGPVLEREEILWSIHKGHSLRAGSSTTPIIPASGTFGFGYEFADVLRYQHPGLASPSRAPPEEPRFGNPTPRIAECESRA